MTRRQIHLNFHGNSSGEHIDAWSRADVHSPPRFLLDYYIELARIAERGLFDGVFFAANVAMSDNKRAAKPILDPVVLISALAGHTQHIGFVATMSTSFNEPYNVARTFSSLDHVTGGRAGWNIVTTYINEAAKNFGLDKLPERSARYERADEFVDIVKRLWSSWDDEAVVAGPHGRVTFDGERIRAINHEGVHFKVRGPLQTPRTPQGRPLLFQAGGSDAGQTLAARHADAVFSIGLELEQAQDFYKELKQRVADEGRDPASLHILPGVYLYLGSTEEEAEKKRLALLESPLALASYVKDLATRLGVQPEDIPLDQPVRDSILDGALDHAGSIGHTKALVRSLRENRFTLRQFIARQPVGGPHRVIVGTPEKAAATLVHWFQNGAADGFNVGNMLPSDLAIFVDHVVPLLQKRGLFREGYESTTLRGHYGLAPVDEHEANVFQISN